MSELSNYESAVNSFYLAFFGRPADPAGLAFWSGHLADNGGDYHFITDAFAASEEATVRFGADTAVERITEIYQQLFNRAPEANGLAFWTNAVEQGHASLADVAISVLNGAQGTDADLATLRKQASADFTALVETSGSDYDGYAAVEAARVLVRAVTPGASQDDIAKLVKAVADFADIASNNPAVVDAIASGSTLLALFDTPRGLLDPVVLARALADVAKAAAGSPATLESLLRGGGMDQVLKVMPARATLQDVVDALADGGLPAAIDVVYPPRPVTPPRPEGVTLKFVSVDHDPEDPTPGDNVTNEKYADVTFSFTGTPSAGQKFQYKIGDAAWTDVAPTGKTIVVPHVDLSTGSEQGGGHEYRVGIMEVIGNVVTKVQVQLLNANGVPVTSVSEEIFYDTTPPGEELALVGIVGEPAGFLVTDRNSVDVTFNLDQRDHGFVQWRVKGDDKWTTATIDDKSGTATLKGIDLSTSDATIEVRVIDAAGNVGKETTFDIDGPAGISVTPGPRGLTVESQVDGKIVLSSSSGQTIVTSDHTSEGAAAGRLVIVGEQPEAVEGYLSVETSQGAVLKDASARYYKLGSSDRETLIGDSLWGFGGNDTLHGTEGNDSLHGGAGDDTIWSNGGSDVISGGAGGDTIFLAKDGVPSTLVYEDGETHTGQFQDDDSIVGMDRIYGAEAGDVILIHEFTGSAGQTVGNGYLTTVADGQVSVVRGSVTPLDGFETDLKGTSYLLQWTQKSTINSILLESFGGSGLGLKFYGNLIALEIPPVASNVHGLKFGFQVGIDSTLALISAPHQMTPVTTTDDGLLAGGEFVLTDMRTGQAADKYTSGEGFGVQASGVIKLNGTLDAGVYRAAWTSETFATPGGTLAADEYLFAGGVAGEVVVPGFIIANSYLLEGNELLHGGSHPGSLYRTAANTSSDVTTGYYNDVIIADEGAVNVVYRVASHGGHDLILGFDVNDKITLGGMLEIALEKQSDGELTWAPESGLVEVDDTVEAVSISLGATFVYDDLAKEDSLTLLALNSRLDLQKMEAGESLLILAKDASNDAAVLLYYSESDGNHEINVNEVTLLAAFADGIPTTEQITLVAQSE
ncbi:DUF4214 domain-containing protein [Massilia sp. HP4]|uniref:DUF4214 domain-containing protein n=1 Tax=Massilia sp. HP4 TaxID=2562316 RepID=UPI0014858CB6|nr:DUF4214 domain-containing protein [Massilia sp. HP4]